MLPSGYFRALPIRRTHANWRSVPSTTPSEVEPVSQDHDNEPQPPAPSESSAAQAAQAAAEQERRQAYRLNKVLGATLTSLAGDSQQARLFIIDISSTGFRATDHQPHNDEHYDIDIVLAKDKEPFRSRMRVVWTKELTVSGMFQMGCEFVEPQAEEIAKLEAFIASERKRVEGAPKAPVDLGRPWTMIR